MGHTPQESEPAAFIVTRKACEYIIEWDTNVIIENSHKQLPIDEFLDRGVYPHIPSFSAKLPLVTQKQGYSDINGTVDSNHYLMTYNWNVYCPDKLDGIYMNSEKCLEIRNHEN